MAVRPRLLRPGLATACALASIRYGFEKLELERIISITLSVDLASRRVMEKASLPGRDPLEGLRGDLVIDRWEWEKSAGPRISA